MSNISNCRPLSSILDRTVLWVGKWPVKWMAVRLRIESDEDGKVQCGDDVVLLKEIVRKVERFWEMSWWIPVGAVECVFVV